MFEAEVEAEAQIFKISRLRLRLRLTLKVEAEVETFRDFFEVEVETLQFFQRSCFFNLIDYFFRFFEVLFYV